MEIIGIIVIAVIIYKVVTHNKSEGESTAKAPNQVVNTAKTASSGFFSSVKEEGANAIREVKSAAEEQRLQRLADQLHNNPELRAKLDQMAAPNPDDVIQLPSPDQQAS